MAYDRISRETAELVKLPPNTWYVRTVGWLLEQEKVAVVSGHAFGADGYIRLSYATSDEIIEKGLVRIASFCKEIS